MAFDINDSTTWPDDPDELMAAIDGVQETKDTDDKPEDKEPAKGEAADKEPAEKTPDEPKAQEPESKEPAKEKEEDEDEGAPIQTADGKHTIPNRVLRDVRAQNKELKRKLAELEAAKTSSPDTTAAEPDSSVSELDGLPATVAAKYNEYKDQWGDAFAEQYLANYRLSQEVAELKAARNSELERTQRTEEEQIQDAIDSSAIMTAWQNDEDNPQWMQNAIATNKLLMTTDAAYARMSWSERFEALPAKVHALYGESPHAAKITPPKAADPTPEKTPEPKPSAVATLSDLPAGGNPGAPESNAELLQTMSATEMAKHIENLSPDKLEAFLASL